MLAIDPLERLEPKAILHVLGETEVRKDVPFGSLVGIKSSYRTLFVLIGHMFKTTTLSAYLFETKTFASHSS